MSAVWHHSLTNCVDNACAPIGCTELSIAGTIETLIQHQNQFKLNIRSAVCVYLNCIEFAGEIKIFIVDNARIQKTCKILCTLRSSTLISCANQIHKF